MARSTPLHPPAQPFDVRTLAVGDGHELYVEQVGTPSGVPAVFLHGGPGSGAYADQRRYFDPAHFRAVLFDQRGAGRSRPKRGLAANTTAHLVADMEHIRETLGISRWMLVGGSWGATLGLAYAEAHPERVSGLVLRSVFLGTREEFLWAFRDAARTIRPELWRAFAQPLPEAERADPIAAWGRRLGDPNPSVHSPAAWMWHDYERALSELMPHGLTASGGLRVAGVRTGALPNTPFMEWHYLSHDCFLAPGQLLGDAKRLSGIPGILVQGRYDLLCPPATSHDLAEAWGAAQVRIVPGAGHAVSERGVVDAYVAAITEMGERAG
ncbi:MAG: prolyl aminopeptidase [Alphaproteobacteria bacterium]